MADRLETYRQKRDFKKTAEPAGVVRAEGGNRYLIQKHDATRLHYDFRLELHGVLLSWAVTRGPSMDPADKRLAVHVEDHPLDYGDFEGTIPKGEYGGGTVMLWDEGTWESVGDTDAGMAKGEMKMVLHGERLKGKFVLVRLKPRKGERSRHENWLLIKERDEYAGPEKKPITERALTSVRTGRTMEQIAAGNIEWTRSGRRFKESEGEGSVGGNGGAIGKVRPRPQKPRAGARRSAKPDIDPPKFVSPQLATLVDHPPEGAGWIHEIKFDGYRLLAAVGGGRAITYTRKGLDWSARFHSLIQPLADLPCSSALLDGEAVVMDESGRSDFGALQVALGDAPGEKGKNGRITYHVFDLLHLDGQDLRDLPLIERKAKLKTLLADQPDTGPIFYSDHVEGHGQEFFEQARRLKLEGIVSKRADAPYRSERSKAWLKCKTNEGQEFIVVGWQPSTVKKRPFSAIVLATRDENRLVYRGRVGSGFSAATLDDLAAKFAPIEAKMPPIPLDEVPADGRKGTHWLRPVLVAEIEFRGWTSEGYVRQGAFKGLRVDKKPAEVVREEPADPPAAAAASRKTAKAARGSARAAAARDRTRTDVEKAAGVVKINTDRDHGTLEIEGVRVTHPDRVMFPGEKITKRMLIDYYLSVADRILPHLADRPLSLVRFPDGAQGDGFYQKHASQGFPAELRRVPIREKNKTEDYLYIDDVAGLVAAVQMGALELHVWGSHVETLEQPDRVVFDFDPDEAVPFEVVKDSAKEMRDRLRQIGLVSFAMVSGGKGMHVVLPLTPRHNWEDIRAFAEAMARTLAAENPDRYLAEMSKKARKGRIFIDYLRNGRGATAISPFSTRARKGAPCAWPVAWSALPKLASAHDVTVADAATVLKTMKKDPWAGYFDVDQVLPMEQLRG
jgi:bifunctional non-homologous end joining protein LigD